MMRSKRYRAIVRILGVFLIILIIAISFEVSARVFLKYKDLIKSRIGFISWVDLDDYEIRDSDNPGNWLLKPGYSITMEQATSSKKKAGKIMGAKLLNSTAKELNIAKNEIVFRVNNDGYRGSEIDKSHSKFRILAIGDSCTFGLISAKSYPEIIKEELWRIGIETEVINAGIEGYGPRNVLYRIEEFKALKPEMTTIYIGWNALFGEPGLYGGAERYLKSIRLLRFLYRRIYSAIFGATKAALLLYNREKKPDRNAPIIRRLDEYRPSFMHDLLQIIEEMQAVNSKVVLVTIPGLYLMDEEPNEEALRIGHLPKYTNNPFVLAKLSEKYNEELRNLGRSYNLQVIDLEEWSKEKFQLREKVFYDSVHLYSKGQEMIGVYMAHELLPYIRAIIKDKLGGELDN